MKTNACRFLNTLLFAGTITLSAAALADDTHEHGDKAATPMSMMDSDHDGQISAREHAAATQKMFERADTDKDGKVTVEEMQAAHEARMHGREGMDHNRGMGEHKDETASASGTSTGMDNHKAMHEHRAMMGNHKGMSPQSMIKSMDTNGDGVITASEHASAMQARFKKMDTNTDGKVSAEEMKARRKAMAAESEE